MKTALRVAISVGVLAALFILLPWEGLWSAASRMSLIVWLGVLAGFVGGHSLGVIKWRRMLGIGRAVLRPLEAVRCYAAGLFANLCLPSIVGGDVLRAVLAGRVTGRPEAVVIGSVGDRLCDVTALAGLAAGGALLARAELPGWGANVLGALALVGVVGTALFVPLALRRPLRRWPPRVRRPIGRTLVALRRLSASPGAAASVLLLSLTIQTGFVLLNAWIGHTVGIDAPLTVWFFAWPVAKVAGLLPVSLGGLGVRDATFGAALASFGVPMASGVAASLIWQTVLVGGGLLAGATWLALGGRSTDATRPSLLLRKRIQIARHG